MRRPIASSAIALALLVSGCGKDAFIPLYIISGGGTDTCRTSHPVHAQLMGCTFPEKSAPGKPYEPVTVANANDKVAGTCLLELSAMYANVQVFDKLIQHGAKVERCVGMADRVYVLSINASCNGLSRGDLAPIFERLQSAGVRLNNEQQLFKHALMQGCVSAARFMLARNADPNLEDDSGLRPLHYAAASASAESIELVKILRQHGADPMLSTTAAEAPFVYAKKRLSQAGNWPKLEAAFLGSSDTP